MPKLSAANDPDAHEHPDRTRLYRRAIQAAAAGTSLDELMSELNPWMPFAADVRAAAATGESLDALVLRGDKAHLFGQIERQAAPSVQNQKVERYTKAINE